jgi:hypothetical protein
MLRVQAPLYRQGLVTGLGSNSVGCRLLGGGVPWRHPLALLWQRHFIKCLSPGPASGGHIPSVLPQIPSWGRVFTLSLAGRGRGARHSRPVPLPLLSGPSYFWPDNRWEALSSSPGSHSPRWSRQPAAGAAGPSGGAGLLVLKPWGLLGCQPAYCPACGAPLKSSPRH